MHAHLIDAQLQALGPNADPHERLEVVWQGYEAATGEHLDRPVPTAQRKAVRDWLRELRQFHDSPLLEVRRNHSEAAVSHSLADKAGRLAQQWCTACDVFTQTAGGTAPLYPLYVSFPIRAMPWSAQSKSSRVALREAVSAELEERGRFAPWAASPICLSVVSLVPRALRSKDVDNLVKGLLDSMQGIVYVNDQQIQCLTSRRIEYAGEVGCYHVVARAVFPWDAAVIYDDPTAPRILSGREVLLPEG